jgi:hypothetical protein
MQYPSHSPAKWCTASKASTLTIATLVLVAITIRMRLQAATLTPLLDSDVWPVGQGGAGNVLQGACPSGSGPDLNISG